MFIYKFGGASVKDVAGVKNLTEIVKENKDRPLVVVVSAMGKSTNILDTICQLAYLKKDFSEQLGSLTDFHREIIKELGIALPKRYIHFEEELVAVLGKIDQYKSVVGNDLIVAFGELMSTSIIEAYLSQTISSRWVDARELIRTDQYFTEANVDWVITEKQIGIHLLHEMGDAVVVTQGFIGADVEGNTTTLGREGSDFTGAILAHCLNATSFTVWKDVVGVLNADPRVLSDTKQYYQLSYREATEMTYYGAQVIHPKTLKPLAQKDIPLIVRSFIDKSARPTFISIEPSQETIPCFIFKDNQILVRATTKNHSFMEEKNLGMILQVLDLLNAKINMIQASALTFSFCIDYKEFKVQKIKELLNRDFALAFEKNLKLATIKNYNKESFLQLPNPKEFIIEQKTQHNYQILFR